MALLGRYFTRQNYREPDISPATMRLMEIAANNRERIRQLEAELAAMRAAIAVTFEAAGKPPPAVLADAETTVPALPPLRLLRNEKTA